MPGFHHGCPRAATYTNPAMFLASPMRWLRCAGCVAGLGCLAAACCGAVRDPAAVSRIHSHRAAPQKAATPWEQAEQAREALAAIPASERKRSDYTRVLNFYRAIYHGNPADLHAPAAIDAVAQLLAEQGQTLHEPSTLKAAIQQYEFLRQQYPASSLRQAALLSEGQIAQNDLSDPVLAQEKYKLLVQLHPRSSQAEEARAALESLTIPKEASSFQPASRRPSTLSGAHSSAQANSATLPPTRQTGAAAISGNELAPQVAKKTPPAPTSDDLDVQTRPAAAEISTVKRTGSRAFVTGIRHWSTANYTRVAIDLGEGVTYEAARVPNPDRIYFDLHGTRLAPELVGKSFAVTDDGFLRKIRPAQYSDDITRVVLDVSDVTEYSAFLLPDPYRLIIDIHGRKQAVSAAPQETASATAPADVPPPHTAAAIKSTPARPVPNTIATRTTPADVADLSQLPGRVEATSTPTSKPISAVVPSSFRDTEAAVAKSDTGTQAPAALPTAASTKSPPSPRASSSSKRPRRTGRKASDDSTSDATPARAAAPLGDGETSLVRALGLKIDRIVIDAGHGGHDSGTLGADGIEEKDVVLDVALRLGKLLHDRLGSDIIYTRSDDTFVPLEARTAIANKSQADLFLSIHANSSSDPTARGVETYYLNFTSDPTALDVAARENAVSDQSIHQLSDLVKKIALKDKISESREFAADVESSLYSGLQKGNGTLKNRGVKKAPFVVLIGANMPSILAEISFVTNPRDAAQLRDPEYRQRVAESLYKGVARYRGGLSASYAPTERAAVGQ
jgi:N-acetylmuramoyl-L-alanine amidase